MNGSRGEVGGWVVKSFRVMESTREGKSFNNMQVMDVNESRGEVGGRVVKSFRGIENTREGKSFMQKVSEG